MAGCAQGVSGRMAIKQGSSPYTWTTGTPRWLPFYRESLAKKNKIIHPRVITGSRSQNSERNRLGPARHSGDVMLPVSPADMAVLWQAILGGTPAGASYTLAETLPAYGVLVDKVGGNGTFELQDAVVDKAMFIIEQNGPDEGAEPNFLKLVLSFVGKSSQRGVTWPVALELSTAAENTPLIAEDGVLTLLGAQRYPKKAMVLIDNHVESRYVVGSLDPAQLCPADRDVVLQAVFPNDDDHEDLDGMSVSGGTGSFAFSNGTIGMTMTFANVVSPTDTPIIRGKTEIDLQGTFFCRKLGSTAEIAVTNDSTP